MASLIGIVFWAVVIYFVVQRLQQKKRPTSRRPIDSAPSHSTNRPVLPPSVDRFPGLDAEMRARVAAQDAQANATLPPASLDAEIPTSLPLKTKQWFFSRSECAFFNELEAALPAGYRVFPNVRLNDLFLIQKGAQQRATYARLRDKHVDFLIVRADDFRPWLAIELDGTSHDNSQQQYRDAVKDVAFRSAGLALLRVRAEANYGRQDLALLLAPYFTGAAVRTVA